MSAVRAGRRVVITGVGVVSPLGSSPDDYWQALAEGRSGVVAHTPLDQTDLPLRIAGLATDFAGKIDDFGPLEGPRKKAIRKGLKVMCRETQMAVAAAQHALADAGFGETPSEPEATGVVLGSDYMLSMPEDYKTAIAACTEGDAMDFQQWGGTGLGEMNPLWMLLYLPNMPASHIAIYNDLRGPNNSLTMREASGLMAIGEAFRIVARGHADRMVAGATGTRVMPMQAIHVMQTDQLAHPATDGEAGPATACRPFDLGRTGMVAGEGSGMVVVEDAESAAARGAKVYGEVVGFGASQVCDRSLNGQNDVALANAMTAALRDGGVAAREIGHVNAHGLATTDSDKQEAKAIAAVFGEDSPPVVAPKSNFGNLGAGSGVVELVASLLALEHGALPRVLNYETPDPECPVNAVTADGVSPGNSLLAVSATPQGQAAALCVAAAK
ncbi:MAG: beta-ketoacyl-[acyl-carrier-protein] synthase family protein [Planctomycetota bacterium]